jgi:hypothetical protein
VQRNRNPQLRLRALGDIAASRDADAFDTAIDIIGTWPRDERREGTKVMLRALAERRIGRRDQANAWIWRLAEYTREVHEEYAVQRWPETKRLLGLLVNSAGGAHARNARRLVHASRKQDRRLAAALLAAALAHTPEAEEVLRGARTRMARKPPALARELLRNFPKRKSRSSRRRRKAKTPDGGEAVEAVVLEAGAAPDTDEAVTEAEAKASSDARGQTPADDQNERPGATSPEPDAKAPEGDADAVAPTRETNGRPSDTGPSDEVLAEALRGPEKGPSEKTEKKLDGRSRKRVQRKVEDALEQSDG